MIERRHFEAISNVKDSAFLFSGFNNWKDATVGFASHEKSMLKLLY